MLHYLCHNTLESNVLGWFLQKLTFFSISLIILLGYHSGSHFNFLGLEEQAQNLSHSPNIQQY